MGKDFSIFFSHFYLGSEKEIYFCNRMKHLKNIRDLIQGIIDWLYRPFKGFLPIETFRYAVCGGSNTALDIFLYFVSYNFILKKQILDLRIIEIKPHIAAFLMVFPITFLTGFLLMRYITFSASELRGRIQLFRYGLTVLICILLNYVLIKFFVEYCNVYPTPSKIITTGFVIIYSYFSQKHFSFKTAKTQ
jgi:putative flippase GtrA